MRKGVRFAAARASRIEAGEGRVDTHIHALPPAYLAELNKAGVSDETFRVLLIHAEHADHLFFRATHQDSLPRNGHLSLVSSR